MFFLFKSEFHTISLGGKSIHWLARPIHFKKLQLSPAPCGMGDRRECTEKIIYLFILVLAVFLLMRRSRQLTRLKLVKFETINYTLKQLIYNSNYNILDY